MKFSSKNSNKNFASNDKEFLSSQKKKSQKWWGGGGGLQEEIGLHNSANDSTHLDLRFLWLNPREIHEKSIIMGGFRPKII